MAEDAKVADEQSAERKPAFVRAEEYILKMALTAQDAVDRLQQGDIIGMNLALGAVKAGALIAILHLREAETGKIVSISNEDLEAMLKAIEEKQY